MADASEEPEQEYVQLKLPSRGDDEEGTVILLPADMADKFIGNCELNVTEGASGSKVIELTTGMLEDDEEPQRKRRISKVRKNDPAQTRNASHTAQGNGESVQLSRVISDDLGKKLMFWRFVENLTMHAIMDKIAEDATIIAKPAKRTIYNFYERVTGGTGAASNVRGRGAAGSQEMSTVETMKAIGRSQPYFQMQMEAQIARADKEKQVAQGAKSSGKHRSFINDDMGRKLFYWRFVENIPMKDIMQRVEQDPIFEENRPKRRTIYQWFERVTGHSNPMSTRRRLTGKNGTGDDERPIISAASRAENRQTFNEAGVEVDRMPELDSNDLARSVANLAASHKRKIDQLEKENRALKSSLIKLQHIFSSEFESLEKQGIALPSLNRMIDSSPGGKKLSKAAQKSAAAAATQNDLSRLGEGEDEMGNDDVEEAEEEEEMYNGGSILEGEEDDDGNEIHFGMND